MPPQMGRTDSQRIRRALQTARMITGMLQGTMGLEGQGLDKQSLKGMTKKTALELLNARR
jgi:hypothetical protein